MDDNLLVRLSHECIADGRRWFPPGPDLSHHTLGMCGEAGEFANLVKKMDRGDFDLSDVGLRNKMTEELADVLIYVLNLAGLLHIDLLKAYQYKRMVNERRFNKERTVAASG